MSSPRPPPDPPAGTDPHRSWHPDHAAVADYSRRSNLALTFVSLPASKRADMQVFYTFCRLVDDIADSERLPPEDKLALLAAWRAAVAAPAQRAKRRTAWCGASTPWSPSTNCRASTSRKSSPG